MILDRVALILDTAHPAAQQELFAALEAACCREEHATALDG